MGNAPSAAVLETLENWIAPGGRARLSPFVESAQCKVLFGEFPDERRRAESIREMIEQKHSRIKRAANCWIKFDQDGKDFANNDYDELDFLDAYLIHYFSLNVPKIQLVLIDLLREGRLAGRLNVLDIGVGTGTTAIAILDFLLLWGNLCQLYGEEFPVTDLHLIGIDQSQPALDWSKRMANEYADALLRRMEGREKKTNGGAGETVSIGGDVMAQVHRWAKAIDWHRHDLEAGIPPVDNVNLIVASNILNELGHHEKRNLEALIARLPGSGLAIILEPGSKKNAGELMRWRRGFLTKHASFTSIIPCGQEFGNRLPDSCDGCWNARRESFLWHPLLERFRMLCGMAHRDAFENELLSWSYVVVGPSDGTRVSPLAAPQPLKDGSFLDRPVYLRFIGAYRDWEPVNYGPDEFSSQKFGHMNEVAEFLKVCPAPYRIKKLAIRRPPGFDVPALRFGQRMEISGVRVHALESGSVLLREPGDITQIKPVGENHSERDFLKPYDPKKDHRVRQALDELAYRLFGFSGLKEFQHVILSRVLTGRSILGIAATGSGKSECFILPAMLLPGLTVVVSPLNALMMDQYDQRICRRYGIGHLVTYINGEVSFADRQARLRRMELGYYKLVYFTPEQLERGYILSSLQRADQRVVLRYLAMDEAHCISQWGHDFRPAYLNISRRLQDYGLKPKRIALTATASPNVRQDICQELGLYEAMLDQGGDVYVESSNRPEINLIARVCDTTGGKVDAIMADLRAFLQHNRARIAPDAAIVFMPWTEGGRWEMSPEENRLSPAVSPFASYLECELQCSVAIYHGKMEKDTANNNSQHYFDTRLGDMSGRSRRSEQEAFISGRTQIMVATKGFGMGIDKPNVRLVIHRTPPANLEAYAQEAGRAGRDGTISSAILYFNPGTMEFTSDSGIQERFLRDKYVRREDIQALYAFLKSIPSDKLGGRYFTNDQAIEFFDHYFSNRELAWPKFQPRRHNVSATGEHQGILDRGHLYSEKSRYLNRILSVAYRVRPDLPGTPRLALLEQVHKTGIMLKNPRVMCPEEIVGSNHYFGRWLREAGISVHECKALLDKGDMSSLARRMNRPLYQVVAMASDIRAADSRLDNEGRLRPILLDFDRVEVPFLGPAEGKFALAAWREYAGAVKRVAKPEAVKRARRAKRPERIVVRDGCRVREPVLTLDDWFGLREMPRRMGWEVQLGEAFRSDLDFNQFLDIFMSLHDQRKENDWASYHRLLEDYIGVNDDGQGRPVGRVGECLRNVMLGYLKSYEIVQDGNCFSCSSCVPDGRFETDIGKRKAAVVRIGHRVEEIMQHLEAHTSSLPTAELIDELFGVFRGENGVAIRRHVLSGWSGRLLDDALDHRGALLLRLRAMLEPDDLFPFQRGQFITYVRQLARDVSMDEARAIWPLFEGIHEHPELSRELDIIYELQADFARKAGLPADEERALSGFITEFLGNHRIKSERGRAAFGRLRDVYAPRGPLADPDRHRECRLELALLSPDVQTAMEAYADLAREWNWEKTRSAFENWPDDKRYVRSARLGILMGWVRAANSDNHQRRNQVLDYLSENCGRVIAEMRASEANFMMTVLGIAAIARRPELAALFAGRLLDGDALPEDFLPAARMLGLSALSAGVELGHDVLDAVANAIATDDTFAEDFARVLNAREHFAGNSMLVHVTGALRPMNATEMSRWFQAVPPSRHCAAPPEVGIRVLECAPAQGLSALLLNALREIADSALGTDEFKERANKRWLELCREHPSALVTYVQDCLEANPPLTDLAVEAYDRVLQVGDWEILQSLLREMCKIRDRVPPGRLSRAITIHRCTVIWLKGRPVDPNSPDADDYTGLRQAFDPQEIIDNADMLVAVIQVVGRWLKLPRCSAAWFKAEALCDAWRLDEAGAILSQPQSGLQLSERALLTNSIGELRRAGQGRAAPPSAKDYERILRLWFLNPTRRR